MFRFELQYSHFLKQVYLFTYFHFRMHPVVCGILVPWPGIEPTLPALEGRVLTTRPPGKSHKRQFNIPKAQLCSRQFPLQKCSMIFMSA